MLFTLLRCIIVSDNGQDNAISRVFLFVCLSVSLSLFSRCVVYVFYDQDNRIIEKVADALDAIFSIDSI